MRKSTLSALRLGLGLGVFFLLAPPAPAQAQATRTWVSGVGNDSNLCSRDAPCKTFPGAISKTAAGGEIDTLDPGGFGGVTITKAITIAAEGTGEGGILIAGTNGVTINAGPNDVVILRGLQIDGGPLGSNSLSGVRFIAGKALQIQHCVIRNFTGGSPNGYGVSFTPVGAGELDVVDSTIVTNGQEGGNQSIGAGIFIAPTGTPDINATLTNLQILNNTNGIRVDTSGATGGAVQVTVRETVVQNSAAQGVSIVSGGGGTLDQVMLDRGSIVNGKAGVVANGATAAVFISNSIVTGNNRGFTILNSGEISSYGNNNVVGNATDGLEFLTPIGTH